MELGDNSSVLPANTPKKLIFDFEDDDGTVVEVVEEVFPKNPVAAEIATTTKLTNKYTITTNENITTKKPQKNKIKTTTTTTKIHDNNDPNKFILITSKSNSNLDLF